MERGGVSRLDVDSEAEAVTTDQPKLGDRAACGLCGREVEYVGYWRHTHGKFRHPANPHLAPKPTSTMDYEVQGDPRTEVQPQKYIKEPL